MAIKNGQWASREAVLKEVSRIWPEEPRPVVITNSPYQDFVTGNRYRVHILHPTTGRLLFQSTSNHAAVHELSKHRSYSDIKAMRRHEGLGLISESAPMASKFLARAYAQYRDVVRIVAQLGQLGPTPGVRLMLEQLQTIWEAEIKERA